MTPLRIFRLYYPLYRVNFGRVRAAVYALIDALRPVPF